VNLIRRKCDKINANVWQNCVEHVINIEDSFLSKRPFPEIYILIREGKPLYPFLSKLRARRSVRFGIVKVYVEKKCRKIKFMNNIQDVSKKRDKFITPSFIEGF
jgi:hypothetical protein